MLMGQDLLKNKKVIVGSVAVGEYTNYGNRLIEQSIFSLLNLPDTTPRFSVFEPISDELVEFINSHDYLIITGCTTLQDDPGHQQCFDARFERLKPRKICFGAGFYCEADDAPALRIARMYDAPLGVRDPWTAEYLTRHGVENALIGCPTVIDQPERTSWIDAPDGMILISSSPPIELKGPDRPDPHRARYVKHDPWSAGEELRDAGVFEGVSLVLTGRLHGALPAIARGIRVRFYGREQWHDDYRKHLWGNVRYSLLSYLGIDLCGNDNPVYPAATIATLKESYRTWLRTALG
jgi:hypothetical protein